MKNSLDNIGDFDRINTGSRSKMNLEKEGMIL